MKYWQTLLWFFSISSIISCSKQNDDERSLARLVILHGNNQSAPISQELADTLILKIEGADTIPLSRFYIEWRNISGSGSATAPNAFGNYLFPDAGGLFKLFWTLGCEMGEQKLGCYLYQSPVPGSIGSGQLIDSAIFTATATAAQGWTRGCGITNLYDPKFTSYQDKIYLVSGDNIYYTTNGGVNWSRLTGLPQGVRPFDMKITSSGEMFMLTLEHGLFRSSNLGNSWTAINNGIIDFRYPIGLLVEDTAAFTSFYFDGLYRSTDNGSFWQKKLINGMYWEQYSYLTRHSSGQLFLADKWSNIFRSADNGNNWERLNISYALVRSPVSGMATDLNNNVIIGSSYDGMISTLSIMTWTGPSVSYYQPGSSSSAEVSRISNLQNKIHFVVTGNSAAGLYQGNAGIYARLHPEFDKQVMSYYLKSDGKYLLASADGIYYKAN